MRSVKKWAGVALVGGMLVAAADVAVAGGKGGGNHGGHNGHNNSSGMKFSQSSGSNTRLLQSRSNQFSSKFNGNGSGNSFNGSGITTKNLVRGTQSLQTLGIHKNVKPFVPKFTKPQFPSGLGNVGISGNGSSGLSKIGRTPTLIGKNHSLGITLPGKLDGKFNGTINGKFPIKPVGGIPIGDGIGNGKPPHKDHDHDHHGHHHHHHHHKPWPWYVNVGLPVCYHFYPTYVHTTRYPGGLNVPVATAVRPITTLAAGVDLQLVDVRQLSEGDAAANLGPLFEVTVGNGGREASGPFQVLLVGTKDAQLDISEPSDTAEVSGLASGKTTTIRVRLPIAALTLVDGGPYHSLGVVVDPNQMVAEAAEENNAALLERTQVPFVARR